jgi:hypothetical protein
MNDDELCNEFDGNGIEYYICVSRTLQSGNLLCLYHWVVEFIG